MINATLHLQVPIEAITKLQKLHPLLGIGKTLNQTAVTLLVWEIERFYDAEIKPREVKNDSRS